MSKRFRIVLIISAIEAVILGLTMFLFDYYPDKVNLNESLLKGLAMGSLIAIVSTLTSNWWLRRAKKHTEI